jgi:prepilin-type N-terminal cleavage/methylation domain-containing protein
MPKKQINDQKTGFTLIELLVVITVIGILAGVVVVILNPRQKQRMAKDGNVFATLNKVILSTNAFLSSYGRVPNEQEFFNSLNVSARELHGDQCTFHIIPDYECLFFLRAINDNYSCDLTFWTGEDGNGHLCNFRYKGLILGDKERYRLYIKSAALPNTVFVYDNKDAGSVYECPVTINDFSELSHHCH